MQPRLRIPGALGTTCAGPSHDSSVPGELARIAELARSRGGQRLALAACAAQLVQRRAWSQLAFARLDDYGRERLGYSGRSLYDLAHTHRKLESLPAAQAALLSGALSWTKARLVARVATPENEAKWLRFARALSADALEKQVRAVDRGALESGAGLEAALDEDGRPTGNETFWIRRCSASTSAKWFRTRQAANRVAGHACPPAVALEMVVAEVLSLVPLEEPAAEPLAQGAPPATQLPESRPPTGSAAPPLPSEPTPSSQHTGPAPQRGGELPPTLVPWLEGLDTTSALELDRRLRGLVALEQSLDFRIGELLVFVAAGRGYRRLGHPSLGSFARERLGMSPSRARALLRLARAAHLCPELRSGYRSGRLSWLKAQSLLPLLTQRACQPYRRRWLALAERTTVRRLENDVAHAVAHGHIDPAQCQIRAKPTDSQAPPTPVPGATPPPGAGRLFIVAPRSVTRLAQAALCSVRRRIERHVGRPVTPEEGFEAMLDYVLEAWGHSQGRPRPEHRVFERDDWRCAVPACSSYRNLHAHHIVPRSRGGGDSPANLVTLCAFHHLRGVHARLLSITGRAPDELDFELPWGRFRSGDVRVYAGRKGSVREMVSSRPGPMEISSAGTSTSASTRST